MDKKLDKELDRIKSNYTLGKYNTEDNKGLNESLLRADIIVYLEQEYGFNYRQASVIEDFLWKQYRGIKFEYIEKAQAIAKLVMYVGLLKD